MDARMRTSLRAFSFSLLDSFCIFTFFMAYTSLSDFRVTWYTSLKEPSPLNQTKGLDSLVTNTKMSEVAAVGYGQGAYLVSC